MDQSDRDFRAGSASIFSSVWPRSEVCGNHLIPDTPAAARGRGRGPSGITSCSASTVAPGGSSFVRLSISSVLANLVPAVRHWHLCRRRTGGGSALARLGMRFAWSKPSSGSWLPDFIHSATKGVPFARRLTKRNGNDGYGSPPGDKTRIVAETLVRARVSEVVRRRRCSSALLLLRRAAKRRPNREAVGCSVGSRCARDKLC